MFRSVLLLGALTINVAEQPLLPGAAEIQLTEEWGSLACAQEVWMQRQIAHRAFVDDEAAGQLAYLKMVGSETPELQIVPYYLPNYMDYPVLRTISSIWQQFRVVINTVFGSNIKPTARNFSMNPPVTPQKRTGEGALIDATVIERQLVWEAEYVNVLYNYRPIQTESKVHLLITAKPDAPARNFGELSREQFVDVWLTAQQVHDKAVEIWPQHNVETHVFDKTGAFAGQTQPIYHAHVVVVLDSSESTWAKLSMLWRMIWSSSPLTDEELREVIALQKERFAP